jgi:spermidine synthase
VAEASGQITVFENDAIAFDTEAAAAEEFAHLAALQHAAPKSVLVLGGGAGGLVAELLRHRPERIDYVELDRSFLELVVPRLPDSHRGALEAEPVEVRIADPRRFLEAAGAYDLILVGMPEPGSGQANRFYTREFFALCREHLGPQGVLALRLRGAENVWTPHLARRTSSIHAALSAVFDDVVILPGSINILLASPVPLGRDPSLLAGRLAARGIEGKLVIAPYLEYLYTSDRFTEIADLVRRTRAPVNSDVHPICYQYTLLIWLSLFLPDLMLLGLPVVEASEVMRAPLFWIGGLAVAGLFLLSRRRSLVRRALLAGVAGFAGMVLETILILHYQTRSGVLFQDLGLLLTLFMAGMAVGAAATDALMRRGARWAATGRLPGVVALAAMVGLGVTVAKLLEAGRLETLASTGPALAAVGFLVAALFAYASLQRQPDQRTVIAPLYSADLLGGSVGSIAATLFLIPVIGLVGAVTLTLALVVVALFLT